MKTITLSSKKGSLRRVDTVERIIELALERQSLYFITKKLGTYDILSREDVKRIPAAFVQNYQAARLVSQLSAGYYFELIDKEAKRV